MPATKFVPEVPHAQLQFENLKVKEPTFSRRWLRPNT
jgi:hypothetical protein